MLAKFKRPELYINHGIWKINKHGVPFKAIIDHIHVDYTTDGWSIQWVSTRGNKKCFKPEEVYMSRREAYENSLKILLRREKCLQASFEDKRITANIFVKTAELEKAELEAVRKNIERLKNNSEETDNGIRKSDSTWKRTSEAISKI